LSIDKRKREEGRGPASTVLVWSVYSVSTGLAPGSPGASTGQARCWYGARRFLYVRVLMLRKVDDLNILTVSDLIAHNERGAVKVIL